jgi:hypothetical protein
MRCFMVSFFLFVFHSCFFFLIDHINRGNRGAFLKEPLGKERLSSVWAANYIGCGLLASQTMSLVLVGRRCRRVQSFGVTVAAEKEKKMRVPSRHRAVRLRRLAFFFLSQRMPVHSCVYGLKLCCLPAFILSLSLISFPFTNWQPSQDVYAASAPLRR